MSKALAGWVKEWSNKELQEALESVNKNPLTIASWREMLEVELKRRVANKDA